MDGVSKSYYEYRVVEFKDEWDNVKMYLCVLKKNGDQHGEHFEAKTIEQVFAWLRLMIGAYPGTGFNDDNQPGAAA
jgi:hypothetical protein